MGVWDYFAEVQTFFWHCFLYFQEDYQKVLRTPGLFDVAFI